MALQAQLYLEPGLPAPWTPALLGSGRGFTNTNGVQAVFLGYISAGIWKTLQQVKKKKKKPKQDFGTIKEHMPSTVTLCGWDYSLCQGVFGLEEGVCDCVAACCWVSCGALRWHLWISGLSHYLVTQVRPQSAVFTGGSDSVKKTCQRLKTSRLQSMNAKIFRGMN